MSSPYEFKLSPQGEELVRNLDALDCSGDSINETRHKVQHDTTEAAMLLEQWAQLNEQDHFFSSGKKRAVIAAFRELIEQDPSWVDLEARYKDPKNHYSYTLLHLATSLGLLQAVQWLANAGAPLDSTSEHGTALCIAIEADHIEIAKWLLERGASPHYTHPDSIERDHFRVLISKSPMIIAASKGNNPLVLRLFQLGAAIDESTYNRDCALYQTNWENRSDTAKLLIACGATPNHRPMAHSAFNSTLCAASVHGTVDYLQTLLDAGADMFHPAGEIGVLNTARLEYKARFMPTHKRLLDRLEQRHDEAMQRWQHINQEGTPQSVNATDMIWCSNIGKLDELMELPGWSQNRDHLLELLTHLPPWMAEHIERTQPTLLSPAAPQNRWSTRIMSEPDAERRRG